VTAARFGFLTQTASGVVVSEGQTTTQDLALAPVPVHAVSGQVRDDSGNPLAGVAVTIEGTPIPPASTDAGVYGTTLIILSNSARELWLRVPVTLRVPGTTRP
jgi:hypothetical protein